jgi:hypothetical protein
VRDTHFGAANESARVVLRPVCERDLEGWLRSRRGGSGVPGIQHDRESGGTYEQNQQPEHD